ncbi:OmpH family outer membrane protein [Paenirhodobacter enshiensis]|uniref:OmpH family outer membrane protein n=1 Tax=Paenirhodobacter enshiensis TaxID=1105367 RepID=UPI0035ADD54A
MAQRGGARIWRAGMAVLLCLAAPAVAQQATAQPTGGADDYPTGVAPGSAVVAAPRDPGDALIRLPSPVLTIDWEQLFDGSRWGQRILADMQRDTGAQKAENDRIADQLIAEERALTEARGKIDAATFQARAEEFDARATKIRAEQSAKGKALEQRYNDARNAFFGAMVPLLDEVLHRRGAVVVLDQRAVIRALPEADVTPDMIALVDARMGEGPADTASATQDSDPAGDPAPAQAPASP